MRVRRALATLAIAFPALLAMTACSITADTDPSRIELPPTDALSTETETPSTTTSTTGSDTAPKLPEWTIGRIVALAPRVDNSRFHQGSTTEQSPLQDTSGFHFTTPDGTVDCSTGTNGSDTLACRINHDPSKARKPSDAPAACDWAGNYVTLDGDGAEHGACSNRYPVLYRASIVDYGRTISISRFSCLVESEGIYCLQSRAKSGFSVTATGYHTIFAEDRAPESLVGLPENESTDTSRIPTTGTTEPTR